MILKYLLGGTKPLEDAYANVNLSEWATWGRNFVKQPEGFLTNDIKVYKLHKTLHSSKGGTTKLMITLWSKALHEVRIKPICMSHEKINYNSLSPCMLMFSWNFWVSQTL